MKRIFYLLRPTPLLAAAFFSYKYYSLDGHAQSEYVLELQNSSQQKSGPLYTWGAGIQGQLGLGTDVFNVSVPTEVEEVSEHSITQISAFSDISAAVAQDGTLLAWGKTRGGAIVDAEQQIFSTNLSSPTPISIVDNKPIARVAVGKDHLAALTVDGKVITMGNPDHGKLGHTPKEEEKGPKLVRGYKPVNYSNRAEQNYVEGELKDKKVVQVDCGFKHTVALTQEGKVYTWGYGKEGELGHGNSEEYKLPKLVEGLKEKKVIKIGAGNGFTIALTDEGALYSWGANQFGQLGDAGLRGKPQSSPTKVKISCKAVDFACGEEHAAFISEGRQVFTWGYGNDGQLGHKTKATATVPKKVHGLPDKVREVRCGGGHTGVILENGKVFMFGRGKDGQLGRGEGIEAIAASRPQPQQVFSLKCKVRSIALGTNHSMCVCYSE